MVSSMSGQLRGARLEITRASLRVAPLTGCRALTVPAGPDASFDGVGQVGCGALAAA